MKTTVQTGTEIMFGDNTNSSYSSLKSIGCCQRQRGEIWHIWMPILPSQIASLWNPKTYNCVRYCRAISIHRWIFEVERKHVSTHYSQSRIKESWTKQRGPRLGHVPRSGLMNANYPLLLRHSNYVPFYSIILTYSYFYCETDLKSFEEKLTLRKVPKGNKGHGRP